MATRAFRTDASIPAELAARRGIEPLLERHGFTILDRKWIERGSAITQVDAKDIQALIKGRPAMPDRIGDVVPEDLGYSLWVGLLWAWSYVPFGRQKIDDWSTSY